MGNKLIHVLFLSIILAFAFTFMGNINTVKAEEANNLVFNLVSDVNVVEVDDNISMYLTLDNVTAIKGEAAVLNYDTAKIKYVGCECENSEKLIFAKDNNGVLSVSIISDIEANLNHTSKKLIRLDFKALKGGQASVKVTGGRISNRNNNVTSIQGNQCGQFTFTIHDTKGEALQRIEAGNGSLSDYSLLELSNVNAENLQFVNEDLKSCSCTTYDQVRTRINQNLDLYLNKVICMKTLVSGKAEMLDYVTLGLTSVTAEIIPYANEDLCEYHHSSIADVRSRIASYLAKYKSMEAINAGNASLTDYSNIGASRATDYSYRYINSKVKNSGIVNIAKMCAKVSNIVDNLKTYPVKGTVKSSKDSSGISGVLIKFKCSNGQYLTNNGTEVTTTTDGSGNYNISLPEGTYTAEVSKIYCQSKSFQVTADSLSAGKSFNISIDVVTTVEYRVEVWWGANPRDLDSYLYGTSGLGTSYTMYYGNQKITENGRTIASLSGDITTGHGPEYTTFTADSNGSYRFVLHKCSGEGDLKDSGAYINLYANGTFIKKLSVPAYSSAGNWNVFNVVNGQLTFVNTLS